MFIKIHFTVCTTKPNSFAHSRFAMIFGETLILKTNFLDHTLRIANVNGVIRSIANGIYTFSCINFSPNFWSFIQINPLFDSAIEGSREETTFSCTNCINYPIMCVLCDGICFIKLKPTQ